MSIRCFSSYGMILACFVVATGVLANLVVLADEAPSASAPKRLLLLGQSPDNHAKTLHEYLPGLRVLSKCLEKIPGIETTLVRADEPWTEGPALLSKADGAVVFLSEGAKWASADPRRLDALAALAQRGGGLSVLHWGMGTRDATNIDAFVKLLGGCHGGPDRKYKVLEAAEFQPADRKHPILTGIDPFTLREEFYYALKFAAPTGSVHPLVQVPIDGKLETVGWSWERTDGGRSFGFSGCHFHENWRLPAYRRLVTQAVMWTLKLPVPKEGANVDVPQEVLELK